MTIERLGDPEGKVVSIICRECERRITSLAQPKEMHEKLKAQALADVRNDPHYLEAQTTTPAQAEALARAHDELLPRHAITLYSHHPDQDVFED